MISKPCPRRTSNANDSQLSVVKILFHTFRICLPFGKLLAHTSKGTSKEWTGLYQVDEAVSATVYWSPIRFPYINSMLFDSITSKSDSRMVANSHKSSETVVALSLLALTRRFGPKPECGYELGISEQLMSRESFWRYRTPRRVRSFSFVENLEWIEFADNYVNVR